MLSFCCQVQTYCQFCSCDEIAWAREGPVLDAKERLVVFWVGDGMELRRYSRREKELIQHNGLFIADIIHR
jgi:hypothetical protein